MKKLFSILNYTFNDGLLMFLLGAVLALAFSSYTTIKTLQELDRLLVCK